LKNLLFYAVVVIAAMASLLAWRKWAVDIQLSAEDSKRQSMRIISVSPNITEIIFALELEDSLVGVTDFCNYPRRAQNKQSIGTILDPDIETILSLNPTDVFVTNTGFHIALGEKLADMGLLIHILDVDRIEGIIRSIIDIGAAADCIERSRKLNAEIMSELNEVKAAARGFETKPRALIVIQPEPIIAAGKGTYIDEILNLAGGENIITSERSMYPMINAESLVSLNPDLIIESQVGATAGRSRQALSRYKWNVDAVINENVFVVDADVISRPGPRVAEAARQMQTIISEVQKRRQ
jgi:iron complex transport system substrate-binding protein